MGDAGRGRRRSPALLLIVVGSLLASAVIATPARAARVEPIVTGWIPGWSVQPAVTAVMGNADLFSDVSPFWHTARASGRRVTLGTTVASATVESTVAAMRRRGIVVLPSVADMSAPRAMAAVLRRPKARRAHVRALARLADEHGYDGLELDYEVFAFGDGAATWRRTRPAWVAFVTELGAALRAAGKKLALAVPPMYDDRRGATSGYWVYDYAGVAPAIDSLRIMTYDYSVARPGPIAPLAHVRRSLRYAVSALPAARIRMGLPGYGRLWPARRRDGSRAITGTCPAGVPRTTSFEASSARAYLRSVAGKRPTIRYDRATGERVATMRVRHKGRDESGAKTSCRVRYEAWWVSPRGVDARMRIAAELGVGGVAVWHLGGLAAGSWPVLRTHAAAAAQRTPMVRVKASTARPRRGAAVTLKVRVRPSRKAVVVRAQVRVKGRWRTVAKARTDRTGRVTFRQRWPKRDVTRTYRIRTSERGTLGAGTSGTLRISTR